MGSDTKKPRVACVEDWDSDEQAVRGSKRSAKAKDKSKGERHSRSHRSESSKENSPYSSHMVPTGSDKSSSPTKSKRVEAMKEQSSTERESRRKSTSGASATQSPRKSSSRPPLQRSHVTSPPQLEIPVRPKADPSYYGVSPNSTYTPNSSIRTTKRPVSYYGGMPASVSTEPVAVSRPPMARSAFYASPVGSVAPMPTSYPMASPSESFMRYASPSGDSYIAPTRPNHLAERFSRNMDPISRTTSAQGMKLSESYLNHASDSGRHNGIRRSSREAEDVLRMPPPPAGPIRRQSRVIDSRDLPMAYSSDVFDEGPIYEPRSARSAYQDSYAASGAPRRPSVSRGSTYDYGKDSGHYRIETSNQGRRRSSYYEDQSPQGSNYEEKLRAATGYQNEVAGEPVSLTREALRKQERTTASSRSTRSSGSRDESDFKRSATTRTTTSRVEGEGDDITIRVKGTATVKIGGAEINCDDGTELNLTRSKSIRNGSERSESDYGKIAPYDYRGGRDRKTIIDSRSASKSGYSRPVPIRFQGDFF